MLWLLRNTSEKMCTKLNSRNSTPHFWPFFNQIKVMYILEKCRRRKSGDWFEKAFTLKEHNRFFKSGDYFNCALIMIWLLRNASEKMLTKLHNRSSTPHFWPLFNRIKSNILEKCRIRKSGDRFGKYYHCCSKSEWQLHLDFFSPRLMAHRKAIHEHYIAQFRELNSPCRCCDTTTGRR